jgi:hypothetical protein
MVISSTFSKETSLAKDALCKERTSLFLLLAFPITFRAPQTLPHSKLHISAIGQVLKGRFKIEFLGELAFLILQPYLLPWKVLFSLTMSLG